MEQNETFAFIKPLIPQILTVIVTSIVAFALLKASVSDLSERVKATEVKEETLESSLTVISKEMGTLLERTGTMKEDISIMKVDIKELRK